MLWTSVRRPRPSIVPDETDRATTVPRRTTSDSSERSCVAADSLSIVVSTVTVADDAVTIGVVTDVPQCAMRSGSVKRRRTCR